jgi:HD-like signal output (HDOD) protein
LFDLVMNYGLTFYQVEQKLFDINHAEVGGLMASKWNFPTTLVDAIKFHHNPTMATTKPDLAALVNIANALCPLDPTILARLGKREIHSDTLKVLNIKPESVEGMRTNMTNYYRVNATRL